MALVDNNVLSSFAKIGRLDHLNRLFEEVSTTPAVLDELHKDDVAGFAFVERICIAVAESRERPLVTDDGHAGEMASQRGVDVWDLKLVIAALLKRELIRNESELDEFIAELRRRDNYRFSNQDRDYLYGRLKQ